MLLVLQAAQLLIVTGNRIKDFENFRLELSLHGGEREIVLCLLVLFLFFRLFFDYLAFSLGAFLVERGLALIDLLRIRARIGGIQIDNVAEQNVSFIQLIAPDNDRLEAKRAFAETRNHGLTASFNTLGDGDFAFARQKLNRSHFTQIHADGIICALKCCCRRGCRFGDSARCRSCFCNSGAFRSRLFFFIVFVVGFGFVILDDCDAHFREHRHRVFDLFRAELFRRQNFVQFIIGNKATRLCRLDEFLYARIRHVEQRPVALFACRFCWFCFCRLRRHSKTLRLTCQIDLKTFNTSVPPGD